MNFKLVKFSDAKINEAIYNMYKDIPEKEMGSVNKFYNVSYSEFEKRFNSLIVEENVINPKSGSACTRYIFFVDEVPVGEIGIRTTLNDFWINKGSQIFYKISKKYRNKGYGNTMLKLALEECKKMNMNQVRINCDDKNIPSRIIIEKNGGKLDISSYSTSDGTSSSYIIFLDN